MNPIATITLPSFLRRSLQAYLLKAKIRALGGKLTRIGRSRNWQLVANAEQINDIVLFIEQSEQESWLWLAKHLRQQNQQLCYQSLLNIAKKNAGISVNELMAKTDCTIAEARKVLDDLEWLD